MPSFNQHQCCLHHIVPQPSERVTACRHIPIRVVLRISHLYEPVSPVSLYAGPVGPGLPLFAGEYCAPCAPAAAVGLVADLVARLLTLLPSTPM